jgi:hypothetical protein
LFCFHLLQHRALLYSLAASLELLAAAQAAEAAAAAALAVPAAVAAPPAEGKLGGAEAAAAGEADSKDLEAAPGADDGTAASKAGEEGAAAGSPPAAPGPSALRGRLAALAANPYVASLAVLLVLASPLPAVKLVLEACWGVARSLPRLLSGRMSWRTGGPRFSWNRFRILPLCCFFGGKKHESQPARPPHPLAIKERQLAQQLPPSQPAAVVGGDGCPHCSPSLAPFARPPQLSGTRLSSMRPSTGWP